MFDTSAMMISSFTHSKHCEIPENILASVFDRVDDLSISHVISLGKLPDPVRYRI